jgi:glyoxylase-like metal-dependent hydrolase (beta-lactamase superfamily II)
MSDPSWTEPGAFEVLPGVYRLPLPLPNDGLRAVNVYAIEDRDGLVMIDAGWALTESRQQLERALAEIGHKLADIGRFLVTHAHRDHYSQALTIREEFGTSVFIGAGERPTIEAVMDPDFRRFAGGLEKLQRAGAAEFHAEMTAYRTSAEDREPPEVMGLPDGWLADGVIELNTRSLRSIPTPGHTVGHLVFHDAAAAALFAGDHVLPQITPSIGLEAVSSSLPLGDYLNSLQLMLGLPDAKLLPAHGPVTESVHARVDALLAHHEQRLAECAAAVESGADLGYEVAQILRWTRRERHLGELDEFNKMLAISETLAHLDVLVVRGWLTVTTDADGVAHFARLAERNLPLPWSSRFPANARCPAPRPDRA